LKSRIVPVSVIVAACDTDPPTQKAAAMTAAVIARLPSIALSRFSDGSINKLPGARQKGLVCVAARPKNATRRGKTAGHAAS
jgi:hypothetical protein